LKKEGTLALIGPMADNFRNMQGTWSVAGDPSTTLSLLDGIKKVVGDDVNVLTARGSNFVEDAGLEKRIGMFGKDTKRDNRSEEEMIKEALRVASQSDVIVAAMGEASESSGESSSLTTIEIPANQRRLMEALIKTGKPLVMVLFAGRPLAMKWEDENVPAILNVWFGGSEGGLAIADILFGNVNPSGKLTTTFPQTTGQLPMFYSQKNTGRPLEGPWFEKFKSNYLDVTNDPVYPFGYGLSYSQFAYGQMTLSAKTMTGNDLLKVSVTVTNTSDVPGKEIVQLYIHDVYASATRPNKELKAFKKISLAAGESREVEFEISTELLKFYMYDPESGYEKIIHTWEEGDFEIMIGPNSRDLQVETVNWKK
jgi:beta-glucosidase